MAKSGYPNSFESTGTLVAHRTGEMLHPTSSSQRFAFNPILIGGLILYVCAFAILLQRKGFDASGAVVVLIVFGIVFPFLAWASTRRAILLSISVKPNKSQLIVLIGYIVVLSIYLVGGPQWIDQHLPSSWIDSARTRFLITLAKKLVVFVAIPFVIFRYGFGYKLRDFGIQRQGVRALRRSHLPVVLVVGGAFLIFQYFLSGGGASFRQGHFNRYQLVLGLPLCFIWLFIEAGLVEEFFFRHAGEVEGLGANPNALDAVAYCIVVLAVSGLAFGIVWARTKNLFAVMLIHAAGDLL